MTKILCSFNEHVLFTCCGPANWMMGQKRVNEGNPKGNMEMSLKIYT